MVTTQKMWMVKADSNVGDFNTGVGMHGAAFGSRDGLNSGLSGQGAAGAVAAVTSFHRVTVCPQPQRTLDNEKARNTQCIFIFNIWGQRLATEFMRRVLQDLVTPSGDVVEYNLRKPNFILNYASVCKYSFVKRDRSNPKTATAGRYFTHLLFCCLF